MGAKMQNSYFQRDKIVCGSCGVEFTREELLTGNGRVNAGPLTDEFHRLYLPKKEFGEVFPLIYHLSTCPSCFLSLWPHDFTRLKSKNARQLGSTMERSRRKEEIRRLLGSVPDLTRPRDLRGGISAYLAAIFCYDLLPAEFYPVFRQGTLCLRTAWLLAHLHNQEPGENFGYAAKILYRKASYLYMRTIELSDHGEQTLSNDLPGGYGPDTDNNFGLDGCIYLSALLQYKYGQSTLASKRHKTLELARRHISLLVGSGKTSQRKTSSLLESARALHRDISTELKQSSQNL